LFDDDPLLALVSLEADLDTDLAQGGAMRRKMPDSVLARLGQPFAFCCPSGMIPLTRISHT
jgi:hypothetical protein